MLSYLTFTWAYGRKPQSALLDTAQQLPTVALLSGTATLGGHLWHLGLPIFFRFAVPVAVSRRSHCGCHVLCWLPVSLHDKKGEREYFVQFQGIRGGRAWYQEAAGHVVSTLRRWRVKDSSIQLVFPFFLNPGSME